MEDIKKQQEDKFNICNNINMKGGSNKSKKKSNKKGNKSNKKSHEKEIKQFLKKSDVYAPYKYFKGLTLQEAKKRHNRIKKGIKSNSKNINSYKSFKTDFRNNKRIKTKASNYTKQFKNFFPEAKSLKEKSKATGVPLTYIKKVYNKGLAAWRTGHRPGATSQQWGYARVHSFLLKGKTFYTADSKLAEESINKSKKAKKWFNGIKGVNDK